jgi:LAO/AO transport system kinase
LRAAIILGITGSPGSGKSTFTAALVKSYRKRRPTDRVGVIAVDPSSAVTRGALLGDRIRMMHLSDDPLVFIRSLAARGHLGGLSRGVDGVIAAMQMLGCVTIIIETVGVGQNEMQISGVADFTAVVLSPGHGDDIQLLKAGMLEVADAVVVNKADDPNSNILHQQVLSAMEMRNGLKHKPAIVALVSAVDAQGVEAFVDELDRVTLQNAKAWQARRK